MALPGRPSLRFELPPRVFAGEPLEGALVLGVGSPVTVRSITVRLDGLTTLSPIGSLTGLQPFPSQVEVEERVFSGELPLAPGERRFGFALLVPGAATPSYETGTERRRYTLSARVEVAWWLPATIEQRVEVESRPEASIAAPPRAALSAPVDGEEGALFELSIDAEAFHAGDLLRGRVRLVRGDQGRVEGLGVSLDEYLGDGIVEGDQFYRKTVRSLPVAKFDAGALFTGEPLGFSLALPGDLLPSFRSLDRRRWYELSAQAHERGSRLLGAGRATDAARLRVCIAHADTAVERPEAQAWAPSLFEAVARALGGSLDEATATAQGSLGGHPLAFGPAAGGEAPGCFEIRLGVELPAGARVEAPPRGGEGPDLRAAWARLAGAEVARQERGLRLRIKGAPRGAAEVLEWAEALAALAEALAPRRGPYRLNRGRTRP